MKSLSAISTVLFLAASSSFSAQAAPTTKRAATEFDITQFSANTEPHGDGAYISYSIDIPTVLSTTCTYSDATSTSKLPAVSFTPCADPAVDWQFRQDPGQPGAEGRYRVVVRLSNPDGSKTVGFHEWAPADFPLQDFGSTQETVYVGASDFVISNLS